MNTSLNSDNLQIEAPKVSPVINKPLQKKTEIATKEISAATETLAKESVQPSHHGADRDRSPYLVNRLLQAKEKNLFAHVKFHLVKQEIDRLGLTETKILDIGCGLQVSRQYLEELGLSFRYFGMDYEPRFEPDAVVDLMNPVNAATGIPFEPDVILALDVLEHLHEDVEVLEDVLANLRALVPDECTMIITLPQMYRLDRFKLSHLFYPEHKIRLRQDEWRKLLETQFDVERVQGLGYLSVIPYLPMASKRYTPENRLGKLFNYLRGTFFEWGPFKPADLFLSNTLGKLGLFKSLSNDVLFVAKPKPRKSHNLL